MWYYNYYYNIKESIEDILNEIVYITKIPNRLYNKRKTKCNEINNNNTLKYFLNIKLSYTIYIYIE